jgi:hypothetical protein
VSRGRACSKRLPRALGQQTHRVRAAPDHRAPPPAASPPRRRPPGGALPRNDPAVRQTAPRLGALPNGRARYRCSCSARAKRVAHRRGRPPRAHASAGLIRRFTGRRRMGRHGGQPRHRQLVALRESQQRVGGAPVARDRDRRRWPLPLNRPVCREVSPRILGGAPLGGMKPSTPARRRRRWCYPHRSSA